MILPAVALPSAAEAAYPGANGRIAFDRTTGGSSYVYTVRSDGSKLIRLPCSKPAGDGSCHDSEPGWSRDGRFLAVANSAGIAVLRANGKFVRQVVTDALLQPPDEASGDPSWAPGGGRLVFTRQPDFDSPNVYVIGATGTGLRRVATEAVEPVWSIRNRIAIGGFGLVTMNAKGKKLRTVYSREVTARTGRRGARGWSTFTTTGCSSSAPTGRTAARSILRTSSTARTRSGPRTGAASSTCASAPARARG